MNLKHTVPGIILILVAVWTYSAMSSFKIEEGSNPERLIIREGNIRTENEVAEKLSEEMGFDLEGAYKTGYTPRHVVEYLLAEPHEFDVTLHNNSFYEGRLTILRMIPLAISFFMAIIGIGLATPKTKLRRPKK